MVLIPIEFVGPATLQCPNYLAWIDVPLLGKSLPSCWQFFPIQSSLMPIVVVDGTDSGRRTISVWAYPAVAIRPLAPKKCHFFVIEVECLSRL